MNPQKLKNLFLRQSYQDAWADYDRALKKTYFVHWDYVILTASNEEQAAAYEEQIALRLDQGTLPSQTCYAVLPDPDGKRVGSGGATFNVIKYIREHSEEEDCFTGKRILVIHSGGDSKRVPQYSACGKLFSPVPRELPDGRRSTLFDEFMISMAGMPARFKEGMLILSGDVLLLFNPLQIDFAFRGAAAISIKEPVETGKDHGVFLSDDKGMVGKFLHKQSIEQLSALGAVNAQGNVDLDTGAIALDTNLLRDLFGLISENGKISEEKFDKFVNEKARVSFYGDFLYPLASEATYEQYLKEKPEGSFCPELMECREALWKVLSPYQLKLICLSPAQFIHFGTTRELLALMTEEIENYEFLDWKRQILGVEETSGPCAYSNSYIENGASVPATSYIEDSYIYRGSKVGEHCVISGVTLRGQEIPDGVTLHGLKLKDGRFVVRAYGTLDNPKGILEEDAGFLNTSLKKFIEHANLTVEDVWPDEEHYLWFAKLYPVCGTIEEAVESAVLLCSLGREILTPEAEAFVQTYAAKERMSLYESFNQADTREILEWQRKLNSQVQIAGFIQALENRRSVSEAKECFGVQGISAGQVERLTQMAKEMPFGLQMRVYYYLSKMTEGSVSEELENKCFKYLCDSLNESGVGASVKDEGYHITEKDVTVRLPIRVNFGGGWSDTPPYCVENGGRVVNAAVKLNGILPVVVTIRHLDKPCIALSSTDSGHYHEFTNMEELQKCNDPFDPFALHKAALLTCGIIPSEKGASLEPVLEKLQGGLYLNTEVIGIPRGSGLGTSSILAGACVKGIFRYIGREATAEEMCNYVLCMEQRMSTGGGWQDQVGALMSGVKMAYTKPGLRQEIKVEQLDIPEAAMNELKERFALIYTGQRRLARNLLREVVGGYIGSNPNSLEVLSEIQRKAVLMRFELEKGNVDGFAKLLDEHWELSKRLDSGCTNTCIEQIFLSCEDMLAAKMICGAGGGGFLQVILKKGCTKENLRKRIREVFQDSGVDVWDCELI